MALTSTLYLVGPFPTSGDWDGTFTVTSTTSTSITALYVYLVPSAGTTGGACTETDVPTPGLPASIGAGGSITFPIFCTAYAPGPYEGPKNYTITCQALAADGGNTTASSQFMVTPTAYRLVGQADFSQFWNSQLIPLLV